MKQFQILPALILLGVLFTNCKQTDNFSNNETIKTNDVKTTEVRFIGQWLNEGKREKLVRDFVREYEFKNQHIDVILKFPEEVYFDRSDLTKTNQAFIAKIIEEENPEWDIIRINNQFDEVVDINNDPNWAKDNLVDFSGIPEFINTTSKHLLTQETKDYWGGIIPGPFIEGQYWALWSNKNIADKLGIEIKQYGMTANDFLTYLKAVDNYNKNNPNDYIVPIHDASDWSTSFSIAFQLFVSAYNNNDNLLNVEVSESRLLAWHKTLNFLEQISKYNIFSKDLANVSWNDSKNDLLNEKCLFYCNGSWMYNIWEQSNPKTTLNCYPNEFPVFNEVAIYPGSYQVMWGVLKKATNKEEAIKLLLSMNTPDIADMWVKYTKCPTGIKTSFMNASFGADQFEEFSVHIKNKYGNSTYHNGEQMAKHIFGENYHIKNYFKEVMLGEVTANEAMEQIRVELGF